MTLRTRKWLIVAVLHLVMAFTGTITSSKGIFFPSLLQQFNLSRATGATLLSVNAFVGGGISLLGGWLLVRRIRAETLLTIVVLFVGLGFVLAGFAQSYRWLVAAYALMAGGGIMLVVAPFVLSNWFVTHRGIAIGTALAGTTTSGVVFNPIISLVVSHWGWRVGYISLGLTIAGIGALAILAVVRTRPGDVDHELDAGAGEALAGLTLHEALRTHNYWVIMTGYFLFWASTNAYFLHFIPAVQQSGFSLTSATLIMSILFLLAAATKLGFGAVADRADLRLLLPFSLAVAGAGLLILAVYVRGGSLAWFNMFVPVYGLTYSAPLVLFPMLVAKVFGRRQFTIIDATIMVTGSALGSLGGVFAGFLFDRTGNYTGAFASLGLAMIAIALILWLVLSGKLAAESAKPQLQAAL